MARPPPVIPLAAGDAGRFLPWLIGIMVYLAALAVMGVFTLNGAIEHWDAGLAGSLTVQLPRPVDGTPLSREKILTALGILRSTEGVRSAEPLADAEIARVLEPWLGHEIDPTLLPLPIVIDVRSVPDAAIDTTALRDRLDRVVPGAVVAGHGEWLGRLFLVARLIELTGFVVLGLVTVAAVLTVVFSTQTALQIHREVIGLLHLIGADDAYVATQFQWHAARLALWGGGAGLAAALATLAAIMLGANGIAAAGFATGIGLAPAAWVGMALLPPAGAAIGLVTARITVLRALARMP